MEGLRGGDKGNQCIPFEDSVGAPECGACSRNNAYLSTEEEEILKVLRELKEKARFLSTKIEGLRQETKIVDTAHCLNIEGHPVSRELSEYLSELEALKEKWRYWTSQREKATARKLASLGHGPGQDVPLVA